MILAVSPLGRWSLCNNQMFMVDAAANDFGIGMRTAKASNAAKTPVTGVSGVRFDGPVPLNGDVLEKEVRFEQCVTRTLSPALTLEEGLEKLKAALHTVKLQKPSSSTGFLRFQVAVPPASKAFALFCSQPLSSSVFPLLYLSKDNADSKSLYVNGARGVCAIGAAVSFLPPTSDRPTFVNRFFSVNVPTHSLTHSLHYSIWLEL